MNEKNDISIHSSFYDIFIYFIKEFFEAFFTLLIIRLIFNKTKKYKNFINLYQLLQTSLYISFILLFIEFLSPEWNTNVKSGISFTVGTTLIN